MPQVTGVQFEGDKFLETIQDYNAGKRKAYATALAMQMEDVVGEIKQTTLGPHVWDTRQNWRILKLGVSGKMLGFDIGRRFAQAVAIAKREGHSDFHRGESFFSRAAQSDAQGNFLKTKRGKLRTKLERIWISDQGSGWKRALELFPRMTGGQRPPWPQVLWMQTRQGRASVDWGMKSIDPAIPQQGNHPEVGGVPAGQFVMAYIWVKSDYMRAHEESGRYPFAAPVLEKRINSGEFYNAVQGYVKQFTENFIAGKRRRGGA